MSLDLAQLQALAAAVDTGTFDAAARRLHVTPSAISQRIRALENSVGSILLTRSKPVRVTEAGATYLALARKIDALTLDALAAQGSDQPLSLPIAVNGDSLATWVLPALAPLAGDIRFTFHREDQDHSTPYQVLSRRIRMPQCDHSDCVTPSMAFTSSPCGSDWKTMSPSRLSASQ